MVGSTHILTQRPPKPMSPATAAPQQCGGVTPIPNPYSHPPFPVPTPTLCGWPGVLNVFAPSNSFASAGFNGINLRWASGSSVLASCPGGLLEDFAAVQWQNRAADSARWGPGAGWLHIGQFNRYGKNTGHIIPTACKQKEDNKARKAVNMFFSGKKIMSS